LHNGQNEGGNEQIYEELKSAAKEVGLSFNINKTKIMVQSRCHAYCIGYDMKTEGGMIEVIDEFVCLGACIIRE
jgi:hypothetical protein